MSVESEILRIQRNVADAYTAVAEMGGNIPVAAELNSGNLAAAVRSIPSIAGLKTDNTLTETDGTLGVTAPVQGVLSQEEFDALPEEQRNKGLYVIPGEGGEGGGGRVEPEGEIYSTEETRIGTWIDGKPIYRKVIETSAPLEATSNWLIFDSKTKDIESMVGLRAILKPTSLNNVAADGPFSSFYYTYSSRPSPTYAPSTNQVYVYCNIDAVWGQPITIIMEYTKTTDTEVTA